jgi:hypothetical protein
MSGLIPVFTLLLFLAAQPAIAAILSGTVTDSSGKPIKDARIDHTGRMVVVPPTGSAVEPSPDEAHTDAEGRFRAATFKSAVVIRKPGYISQRLLITGDAQVQITLKRIEPESKCKHSPPLDVKKKKANDIDYTATWSSVETKDGPQGIISGSGAMYSFGAPSDAHVWTSLEYAEVMYESGMIDASGHSADGKYWRSRSVFGAAAQYYNVNRETADQLDCVMEREKLP